MMIWRKSGLVLLLILAVCLTHCDFFNITDEKEGSPDPKNDPPSVPGTIWTSQGVQSLDIYWSESEGAATYTLFWSDNGGDPSETSSNIADITTTDYTHSNLDYTKTYKYRICATNQYGSSALSAVVSGTPNPPPLQTPANLTATAAAAEVGLDWDDNPEPGITYTVFRRKSTLSYSSILATGLINSLYTDSSVDAGVGYVYAVRADLLSEGRSSNKSGAKYAALWKTVGETERNSPSSTLSTTIWYHSGNNLQGYDRLIINGKYNDSIYNAYSYKYYDYDVFKISLKRGDTITFQCTQGTMGPSNTMTVKVLEAYREASGSLAEISSHTFYSSFGTYTFREFSYNKSYGVTLVVGMPEDLIGPYNYQIRISIQRKQA